MNFKALATLAFATGCNMPPIWEPGDLWPVEVYATPNVAEAAREGCLKWKAVGLTCVFVDRWELAELHVTAARLHPDYDGLSYREARLIVLDTAILGHPEYAWAIAAHEIGHQMHLGHISVETGDAIMTPHITSYDITQLDVDALFDMYPEEESP